MTKKVIITLPVPMRKIIPYLLFYLLIYFNLPPRAGSVMALPPGVS